jgi:GTP-binding protein
LIEGAHEGTGLGLEFLRHIERTKLLVHVVDVSSTGRDTVDDFLTISRELELYKSDLLSKPQVVAASKMDALDNRARVESLRDFCRSRGLEMFEISAVTGLGIKEFVAGIGAKVEQIRSASHAAVSSS